MCPLLRPDLFVKGHHVWDGWLTAEVDFPPNLTCYYTHTYLSTHIFGNTHIQISCQPLLNTCSLTQEGFDWFCFSQAFKFNLQLESYMCASLCVCACMCVREWSQLYWLRINSIENTLFLFIHHSIPFTLLVLAFAFNISLSLLTSNVEEQLVFTLALQSRTHFHIRCT